MVRISKGSAGQRCFLLPSSDTDVVPACIGSLAPENLNYVGTEEFANPVPIDIICHFKLDFLVTV